MADLKSCDKCKYSSKSDNEYPCNKCVHSATDKFKPKTNADKIRAMDDEELAKFLVDVETHGYHDQSVSGTLEMIDWLKSEAE